MSLDINLIQTKPTRVFYCNVTDNLIWMAKQVIIWNTPEKTLHDYIWNPISVGISKAGELVNPLIKGLQILKSDPSKYRALNPPNGYGSYESFVSFLEGYLFQCMEHQDAEIIIGNLDTSESKLK